MTQVLLLGTCHFREANIDIYTEEAQRQLRGIDDGLAAFNPDAIAVEAPPRAQGSIDASYGRFSPDDFSDFDKMRNQTLGTISIYGDTYPITYDNESIQIGYRLGKRLGLDKIHAIDDDTWLEDMACEIPDGIRRKSGPHREKVTTFSKLKNIRDILLLLNSEKWSYHNHQLYILKNSIGAGLTYDGARFVGQWYSRNLKIFANLQTLCENHERVFCLYGSGHLYILRQLIDASEDMELADYREYL